jgi:hypothetical protein
MLKHRHSIHADTNSGGVQQGSENTGSSTSKPQEIRKPTFSSSESLVSQNIDISPYVKTNENDDSSVIDSDSENEQNETVVANHVAAIQNRNFENLKDLAPNMGPIRVCDSTEVTVGSKLIFEGGSSVTFVVHESRPVDLELNRTQSVPNDGTKPEESKFNQMKSVYASTKSNLFI